MPSAERCPYCNQPLVSGQAVKHLHEAEEKLRRQLAKEADAAAAKKIQKACEAAEERVRREAERERSKRERGLQRTIDLLQKHNEDLERRVDGLNAPDRGDLNEEAIAKDLSNAFPDDEITRKGKGGDIVHAVRYPVDGRLESAGKILYECKDTKRWSNSFISQVKADGKALHTPYLLLVSRALPGKEKGTCVTDDVIVADPAHARHLARILRRMVIETHRAELAGQDGVRKTARLYEYLRGAEFRGELGAVVQAGRRLADMLEGERRDHERAWTRRQNAYDELTHNSVAIEEAIRAIIESDAPERRAHTRNGRRSSNSTRSSRRTVST